MQLTKRADGAAVLRCTRFDGSVTWQRHHERAAMFFPFHDLRHFAVETTLGFRQGFYGLIADGWEIPDTGGKGARGPLPAEAILVEHLVGLFDGERVGGASPLSAAEFNAQLQLLLDTGRIRQSRQVTDEELSAVRTRIDELHRRWASVPPGAALELAFDRRGVADPV